MTLPASLKLLQLYGRRFPIQRGKQRLAKQLYRRLPRIQGPVYSDIGNGIVVELWPWLWSDFSTLAIGSPELFHLRYFVSRVSPDSVFFDIGAYLGIYALNAASIAHRGTIHAFEPNPQSAGRLRDAIERNRLGNIHLSSHAVGQAEGEMAFAPHDFPPASALRHGHDEEALSTFNVPVTTIDQYCRRAGVSRIDFLKIDVEGAELRVLKGARDSIKSFQPEMIIELHGTAVHQFDTSIAEVIGYLQEQLSYSIHALAPGWRRAGTAPYIYRASDEAKRFIVIARPT